MQQVLQVVQIILALALIVMILLQAQGAGLGGSWTGGGETYHTKRGVEKVLLYLTAGGIVAFVLTSIAILLLS